MRNVTAEIQDWAKKLPEWQQIALQRIVAGNSLDVEFFNHLAQIVLEDAALADKIVTRETVRSESTFEVVSGKDSLPRLRGLSDLSNVNCLVPNQTLSFGDQMTVIFGENGSGKSGYARVLASAAMCRGRIEVLPDVSISWDETAAPNAVIELSTGQIQFKVDPSVKHLANFYVFGTASIYAHLSEENEISFAPSGLSHLRSLAEITEHIQSIIREKAHNINTTNVFESLILGDTEVKQLLLALQTHPNLERLKELAAVTSEERQKIPVLTKEIGELTSRNTTALIEGLNRTRTDLQTLVMTLRVVEKSLSTISSVANDAISNHLSAVERSKALGLEQFQNRKLSQVGTSEWQAFVKSARHLAEQESEFYPVSSDICLLCQHELSKESQELLIKLWSYLDGDVEAKVQDTSKILTDLKNEIENLNIFAFEKHTTQYRFLESREPALLAKVTELIEACTHIRTNLIRGLESLARIESEPIDFSVLSHIEQLADRLDEEIKAVSQEDVEKLVDNLQKQKTLLEHRLVLEQQHSKIESYIARLAWKKKALESLPSTRAITEKYNELFNSVITGKYIETFQGFLRKFLHPNVLVDIKTFGRKGETYRQIVLIGDKQKRKTPPDRVLSEGEQRAVALADFLTESSLDDQCSGIIFDDPVTSFDLRWREQAAKVLAQESLNRQVIIFTHDLPFMYFLKEASTEMGCDAAMHWIVRGTQDGRPGYVYLNNSPANERDYRSAKVARDYYSQALKASPQDQELLLKQGFGALRTSYEVLVIYDLFNEVVLRFNERISIGRLRDINWNTEIVDEIITRYEQLSRYIEGHSHSDSYSGNKPTTQLLMKEIEFFETLKKNALGKTDSKVVTLIPKNASN